MVAVMLYGYVMLDHIAILKERLAKAESKELRAAKALESAKNEASDIRTALRVLGDISGESVDVPRLPSAANTGNRQIEIVNILGVGPENGRSPVDLFATYELIGSDDINIDTFRTTIWRMRDKSYVCNNVMFVVQSDGGRYWKIVRGPTFNSVGSSVPHRLIDLADDIDEL
jgi:hypothetical protein